MAETEKPPLSPAERAAAAAATARRVNASLFRICQLSTFFATLALHARVEIREDIPTAATDGRSIFVNPGFFNPLTPRQQDGLLLHEVLHAALRHVPRRGKRDPKLWNIAADIVINGMILATGQYDLPEGGMVDTSLEHLSAEEVYEKLYEKADKIEVTLVNADLLDEPGDDEGQAGDGKGKPGDKSGKVVVAGDWSEIVEKAKLVSSAHGKGDLPGNMLRELMALGHSNIDWRSYLWRFMVQTPTDFGAFDRRFIGNGLYLETIASDNVRLAICADTSGSIDTAALSALLTEVRAVLASYPHLQCDLYYCDTTLYGPYPIMPESAIPEPVGGGGTDFRPFFANLDNSSSGEMPSLAIYLTDGFGEFPEHAPNVPTLWAVLPGGQDLEKFPFGETLRLLPGG